jgi:putative hydrolase of HD superfamily
MTNLLRFFTESGKLKTMPRSGWVLRGIKNPESIAEHTFRVALMAWTLGIQKHNFNIEKLIKIALVHDLCEVYAGDITPYDTILPKNARKRKEMLQTWPRFSEIQKKRLSESKYKKEKQGLEKLTKNLPAGLKKEMEMLWLDYEKGLSKEGRFFRQIDRAENLLQSLEYWQIDKNLPQKSWWTQANELFDDKLLLELVSNMDKEFHKTHKPKH